MWTMTTFDEAAAAGSSAGGPAARFSVVAALRRSWHANRPLTATALIMAAVLVASVAGLVLDPRTVTGAPVWLKPAKFAISISVYALTLVWAFSYLPAWPRTRAIVGWTTAVTLTIEIVVIVAQAWRGTTSHFNIGTPLDAALWSTMGAAIVVQTLASIAACVALWRERFADRAIGWALRLGLTLSIVGASFGGPDDGADQRAARRHAARAIVRPSSARTRWARRTADPALSARDGASITAISACRISSACTRSRRCRSWRWPRAGAAGLTSGACA